MSVRLLHTADWHLGRPIAGRSRFEEFSAVLDEVVEIAIDQHADVLLVAGDIFDARAPGADVEGLFLDTCLRLHDAGVRVVGIAGNHDAPARLAAWRPLLERFGVTLVAQVAPPDQGSFVEFAVANGERVQIACVPFVAERRFGSAAALFDAPESWYSTYAEGVGRLLGAMAEPFAPDAVNVVLAHLFTHGALLGEGERTATIGIDYAVSPARLPAQANYVALGHIHRPQAVAGAGAPSRYAGSLLQLDFGEMTQRKSVAVVEVSAGQPARVEEIALTAGRRLIEVQGTLEQLRARADEFGDAYLRVVLEVAGPTPGIANQVRDALPNALQVRLAYERVESDRAAAIGSLAPSEQFAAWHTTTNSAPPRDELLRAFDEVFELVAEAE